MHFNAIKYTDSHRNCNRWALGSWSNGRGFEVRWLILRFQQNTILIKNGLFMAQIVVSWFLGISLYSTPKYLQIHGGHENIIKNNLLDETYISFCLALNSLIIRRGFTLQQNIIITFPFCKHGLIYLISESFKVTYLFPILILRGKTYRVEQIQHEVQ